MVHGSGFSGLRLKVLGFQGQASECEGLGVLGFRFYRVWGNVLHRGSKSIINTYMRPE